MRRPRSRRPAARPHRGERRDATIHGGRVGARRPATPRRRRPSRPATSAWRTSARWRALLRRPEIGALLAAIVVAIFFWTQNSLFLKLDGIANWTDVASTIGIPAVVVALLMIGGEFDLSAGVMTGSAGPDDGHPRHRGRA